jgi:hypothetical protein
MSQSSYKTPAPGPDEAQVAEQPTEKKSFRKAILPVMACGAGLFSDGYINNVCLLLLEPAAMHLLLEMPEPSMYRTHRLL